MANWEKGRIVFWSGDTKQYAPCTPHSTLKKDVFYRITGFVSSRLRTVTIEEAYSGKKVPGSFCEQWFEPAGSYPA